MFEKDCFKISIEDRITKSGAMFVLNRVEFFPPRGHSTLSGDTTACHSWGIRRVVSRCYWHLLGRDHR